MPSIVGESVGHMVIGIDTSGSIMQSELTLLLSEVNSIAEMVNPEKVDLIYWDHAVAAHETYESSDVPNIVRSTKPRGGGGTNPAAMAEYLFENGIKPECIVMLTDGYLNDWGTWDAPIMWVITNNESCQAPCGMTIHIEG
jgi:predicted metal-dependent peptidase